jgi:hypothetical protein
MLFCAFFVLLGWMWNVAIVDRFVTLLGCFSGMIFWSLYANTLDHLGLFVSLICITQGDQGKSEKEILLSQGYGKWVELEQKWNKDYVALAYICLSCTWSNIVYSRRINDFSQLLCRPNFIGFLYEFGCLVTYTNFEHLFCYWFVSWCVS